ncbi:Permease of the drug/metabolite transporter (DMT) superfamily [Ruminococcaceae bacterium FB2012]|nr:Permease of the drug/metabolite transporter (DMT) superfamily [Ruminococcaceae bacterium FB2012]
MKKELTVFLGAFVCCFLWGSAFPGIKAGYELWNISGSDTFGIIRFAGVRFFLAGILVILFAGLMRRKLPLPRRDELGKIMLLSMFQTVGQYLFFYIGLAHTSGVNSAVVDSLTAFFAMLVAGLFMHLEKLTPRKLLGCLLGFSGVVLINITPEGFSFNPLGDGLVALSALCYGVSSSLIKKYSLRHDTVIFSGYQFVFGGIVMTLFGQLGLVFTGSPSGAEVSLPAVMILIYLAIVSSAAYTLWGILLRGSDVSKISVYGFMTPVTGVILSALILGETDRLGLKYAAALLLIGAGMIAVNLDRSKPKD